VKGRVHFGRKKGENVLGWGWGVTQQRYCKSRRIQKWGLGGYRPLGKGGAHFLWMVLERTFTKRGKQINQFFVKRLFWKKGSFEPRKSEAREGVYTEKERGGVRVNGLVSIGKDSC